eukprot:gnl/TRDRNA2_/TRDRNA2_160880_c0_seq1.p1 gnl/TRDRNA2_/TRDRNA2_160880_c0~~gnl/TRDRNA2_/TRDRNA2_160880_c0_seq1.p1  ORF type:complete len:789 (-),score=90.02 gnl/TRDRNA2_/TRDRNA2_160880_c0_seq1:39-2405(-)
MADDVSPGAAQPPDAPCPPEGPPPSMLHTSASHESAFQELLRHFELAASNRDALSDILNACDSQLSSLKEAIARLRQAEAVDDTTTNCTGDKGPTEGKLSTDGPPRRKTGESLKSNSTLAVSQSPSSPQCKTSESFKSQASAASSVRSQAEFTGIVLPHHMPGEDARTPPASPTGVAGDTSSTQLTTITGGPLELWSIWEVKARRQSKATAEYATKSIGSAFPNGMAPYTRRGTVHGHERLSSGRLQRFVVRPSSMRRLVWDLLSLFVISIDVLVLPLEIAFVDFAFELPWEVNAISTAFWTLDVVFSFFKGYDDKGVIEMRFEKIARHYCSHGLVPDAIIVSADWILLSMIGSGSIANVVGFMRLGKGALRFLRLARLLRLLRILKFLDVMEGLSNFIWSSSLLEILAIAKKMVGVMVVTHFLACMWYMLGRRSASRGRLPWYYELEAADASLTSRWAASFHWAITQFTPANAGYLAQNEEERFFSIFVLLLGFIMFSSVLGSMTSNMTHLQLTTGERNRQMELVRTYLSDHRITLALGQKITNFLRQRHKEKVHVTQAEIAHLQELPEYLQIQLHVEVMVPVITRHPLFHHMNLEHEGTVTDICHHSLRESVLGKGEEVFHYGMEAKHMFFALSADLVYIAGPFDGGDQTKVPADEWLCEAALWIKGWEHRGSLTAENAGGCLVILLDACNFQGVAKRHPDALALCQRYAKLFAEWRAKEDMSADLLGTFDDVQELAQRAAETLPVVHEDSRPGVKNLRHSAIRMPTTATLSDIGKHWISKLARMF